MKQKWLMSGANWFGIFRQNAEVSIIVVDHILIDRRRHSSIIDYEVSGELIVTLITIWWWQKLGKDWQ